MTAIVKQNQIMATGEAEAAPQYFHATLVPLDGKPLYARGKLPTIHSSLTYAVWYIYWMRHMGHSLPNSSYYIYELTNADRYLLPQGDGSFSVSEIGTIPYDDRVTSVLDNAPVLFKVGWNWGGELSYIPARCLRKVTSAQVREEVSLDDWLRLCWSMEAKYPLRGLLSLHADFSF